MRALAKWSVLGTIPLVQPDYLSQKIQRNHVAYRYPRYQCSVVTIGSNSPPQDSFIASPAVMGVADGHGHLGHQVSEFLSAKLRSSSTVTTPDFGRGASSWLTKAIQECETQLRDEFATLDLQKFPNLLQESKIARQAVLRAHAGSTLCVGAPDDVSELPLDSEADKISWWTFANLGDSQAVYINTATDEVLELTKPQNITDPKEQEKLFAAHPHEKPKHLYQKKSYVMGRVQPTSAIGDFHLKEDLETIQQKFDPVVGKNNTHVSGYYLTPPYLGSDPIITRFGLEMNEDTFIVFATDGFWDRVSPDEVKQRLNEWKFKQDSSTKSRNLPSAAAELARLALEKPFKKHNHHSSTRDWSVIRSCFSKNFRDDMTVLVVQ